MLYLGQLGSKPRQRYGVVLRAGDGESSMKNGTVHSTAYWLLLSMHTLYLLFTK